MRWETKTTLSLFLSSFLGLSWVLIIISFYLQSVELFIVTVALMLLSYGTRIYLKKAATSVQVENKRHTIRLFKGEYETLSFSLQNQGKLPIWNGELRFALEPVIHLSQLEIVQNTKNLHYYGVPFFMRRNERKNISFSIHAYERGATRIRNLQFIIKDLFGLGSRLSSFQGFSQTEILIYPELREVQGVEQLSTYEMGSHAYEHSLYENLCAPAGAREYANSDPFNRIHWKATARTSELKTKVYERSIEMRWVFILDLSVKRKNSPGQVSNNIEAYISQLAFLCSVATKRGIAFEIHINLDPEGPASSMVLEVGEGNAQLSKALELLARIDDTRPLLSFERMSSLLKKRLSERSVLIRLGEPIQSKEEETFYQFLKSIGHMCYDVKMSDGYAYLGKVERVQN
ncbi:DUF58 domain-containing protein [Pseudalkalibacillus hwajinpoensis]|uniref:DUF58 domain-containing protein n=1 Tax=Guptibacillus hwajinpoensis TaxID=208199 RepID=UPI001CD4A9AA|nr:DUF58 domain-containing protein [Pseudalkalibacillus hwajinpoensis]MCA0990955.1 DUF58 domain-containing protein [Pseudalkalibacillus hwajinpoensis]